MDAEDLYCKVYVNTSQDRALLLSQVAASCLGTVAGRTVSSAELIVDVSRNEDHDPVRAQARGGFVYSPYYLDVSPADGVERDAYVDAIRKLLLALRQAGNDTVAACDFESELAASRDEARLEGE